MRESNGVSLPAAASTERPPGGNRRGEDVLGREQADQRERGRYLGAVQQREAFLRRELEGFQSRSGLRERGSDLPFHAHIPDAEKRKRQVGEGARSPEAPTEPFAGIQG